MNPDVMGVRDLPEEGEQDAREHSSVCYYPPDQMSVSLESRYHGVLYQDYYVVPSLPFFTISYKDHESTRNKILKIPPKRHCSLVE